MTNHINCDLRILYSLDLRPQISHSQFFLSQVLRIWLVPFVDIVSSRSTSLSFFLSIIFLIKLLSYQMPYHIFSSVLDDSEQASLSFFMSKSSSLLFFLSVQLISFLLFQRYISNASSLFLSVFMSVHISKHKVQCSF